MNPEEFFSAIEAGDRSAIRDALATDPTLLESRNPEGLSPLMVAAYWGRKDVLDVLLEEGRPLDFWEAAIIGEGKRLEELIEIDPSLASDYSPDGFTALHFAAFFGKPGAVDVLLRAGADVTTRTTNVFHNQPLHAAVAGSDQRARLDCAARQGDDDLVELLLAYGADPVPEDDKGRSAADHAAQAGHDELANRLRESARAPS